MPEQGVFPKRSQSSPRHSQSYSRASRSSPRGLQCLQRSLEPILGGSELARTMPAHYNKILVTARVARGSPRIGIIRWHGLRLGTTLPHAPAVGMT